MDALLDTLRALVGPAHCLTDVTATAPYLRDWRGRYSGSAQAVVLPADTVQVADVVRFCAAAGVPIVPQGGQLPSQVLGLELAIVAGRLRFFVGSALLPDSRELIGRLQGMVDEQQRRIEDRKSVV